MIPDVVRWVFCAAWHHVFATCKRFCEFCLHFDISNSEKLTCVVATAGSCFKKVACNCFTEDSIVGCIKKQFRECVVTQGCPGFKLNTSPMTLKSRQVSVVILIYQPSASHGVVCLRHTTREPSLGSARQASPGSMFNRKMTHTILPIASMAQFGISLLPVILQSRTGEEHTG